MYSCIFDIEAFKDVLEDSGIYFKNNNLDDLIETLSNLSRNNLLTYLINKENIFQNMIYEKICKITFYCI